MKHYNVTIITDKETIEKKIVADRYGIDYGLCFWTETKLVIRIVVAKTHTVIVEGVEI